MFKTNNLLSGYPFVRYYIIRIPIHAVKWQRALVQRVSQEMFQYWISLTCYIKLAFGKYLETCDILHALVPPIVAKFSTLNKLNYLTCLTNYVLWFHINIIHGITKVVLDMQTHHQRTQILRQAIQARSTINQAPRDELTGQTIVLSV